MNCRDARKLFSPAVDGELRPAEKARLDEHLGRCVACRGALPRHAELADFLGRNLRLAADSMPLSERSAEAPVGTRRAAVPRRAPVLRWVRWPGIMVPVATLAASILLGFFVGQRGLPSRPAPRIASFGLERPAPPHRTVAAQAGDCDWQPVSRVELAALGLPSSTPHADGFRLGEVSLPTWPACGNGLRLCYDSDEGPITVERTQDPRPEDCSCQGREAAGGLQACLIETQGPCCPVMVWCAGGARFRVTGDVSEKSIIELASFIDQAWGDEEIR